jgi:hypothetical protein
MKLLAKGKLLERTALRDREKEDLKIEIPSIFPRKNFTGNSRRRSSGRLGEKHEHKK